MTFNYTLQAYVDSEQVDPVRDEFVKLFGKDALNVHRFYNSVNISLDFDPHVFSGAREWAASRSGVEVREFYTRKFSDAEVSNAPLVTVSFSNCYLWPREFKWVDCTGCGRGDMRIRTGEIPNRIEHQHGIGKCEGNLYLSKKGVQIIESLELTGYEIHPWPNNPKYYELSSTVNLSALVIQGRNVYDVKYPECPACHRPKMRFYYGPDILDAKGYNGEDFVAYRLFIGSNLAFTQKAATLLKGAFPDVELGDPVLLEYPAR